MVTFAALKENCNAASKIVEAASSANRVIIAAATCLNDAINRMCAIVHSKISRLFSSSRRS
jgi:hypothetical protein